MRNDVKAAMPGCFDGKIGVAVLAGGKSLRMGRDKAGLSYDADTTFLEKLCGRLDFFPYRYVSRNVSQHYPIDGFESVTDDYPECGPAGGILSVLRKTGADAVLFVGCDMPDFSEAEAKRLVSIYNGEDVLVPVTGDVWQPVSAVYSVRVCRIFEESLRRGDYRLRNIIMQTDFRTADVPEECFFNYVNINTPGELESFRRGHS